MREKVNARPKGSKAARKYKVKVQRGKAPQKKLHFTFSFLIFHLPAGR
jgi:hypothetical protein